MNSTIKKLIGNTYSVSYTTSGKKIYIGNNGINIIEDLNGKYFRIENTNISGRRRYTDLNGDIPNNKVLPNGKQQGRTQSEYNEVTHFKIK